MTSVPKQREWAAGECPPSPHSRILKETWRSIPPTPRVPHGPQCHTPLSAVPCGSWLEGSAPLTASSASMPRLDWCSLFRLLFGLPGCLVSYSFQEGFPGSSFLNLCAFKNVYLMLASRRTCWPSQLSFPPGGCFRDCSAVSFLHGRFHGVSTCRSFAFFLVV